MFSYFNAIVNVIVFYIIFGLFYYEILILYNIFNDLAELCRNHTRVLQMLKASWNIEALFLVGQMSKPTMSMEILIRVSQGLYTAARPQ